MAGPFGYPQQAHAYRHGPKGYARYPSYRPWLRDEFTFRCVYCLIREQWGRVTGEFDIEHFECQAKNPQLGAVYENLLTGCRACNVLKDDLDVPDPRQVFISNSVRINPDGSIEGITADAKKLILVLGLDSSQYREWRLIWIRNVELAAEYDPDQYGRLMGFPDDLPDLAPLRPPDGNSRPEGVNDSYFALRTRGELPNTY